MNNNWTDERVELLKKLWAEGLSASQIAKRLGGVSRNACIGKAHRLGLPREHPSAPMIKRPPQPRPAPKVDAFRGSFGTPTERTPPVAPVAMPANTAHAKPWTQRRAGECARPVGGEGADTLSCASPIENAARTGAYCAACHKLMRTKAWGWLKQAEEAPKAGSRAA